MKIQDNDGLKLKGTVIASRIDKGKTKDKGEPWAARVSVVTGGTRVFGIRESGLDLTIDHEPLELGSYLEVDVEWAKSEGGLTNVSGPIVQTNNGSSDAGGASAKTKSV